MLDTIIVVVRIGLMPQGLVTNLAESGTKLPATRTEMSKSQKPFRKKNFEVGKNSFLDHPVDAESEDL